MYIDKYHRLLKKSIIKYNNNVKVKLVYFFSIYLY